ncbi:MAG TPA: sulfatase/phosphatase domain-containing protein, partial [Opitutus sp.]|nr:sulfatase/phosphatase domain-containing protein [Opitutus sp.]
LKRTLTEGGIRVPLLARWPGRIAPGTVSQHVGYFGDVFATLAEVAGTETPAGLDSISFVPTLLGRGTQQKHEHLYWEFHEGGVSQAVLLEGRWKGIRLQQATAPIRLFDLQHDIGELHDLAAKHPQIVARIAHVMRSAHVDNEHWRMPPGWAAPQAQK